MKTLRLLPLLVLILACAAPTTVSQLTDLAATPQIAASPLPELTPVPPIGGELLDNGDFSRRFYGWRFLSLVGPAPYRCVPETPGFIPDESCANLRGRGNLESATLNAPDYYLEENQLRVQWANTPGAGGISQNTWLPQGHRGAQCLFGFTFRPIIANAVIENGLLISINGSQMDAGHALGLLYGINNVPREGDSTSIVMINETQDMLVMNEINEVSIAFTITPANEQLQIAILIANNWPDLQAAYYLDNISLRCEGIWFETEDTNYTGDN